MIAHKDKDEDEDENEDDLARRESLTWKRVKG